MGAEVTQVTSYILLYVLPVWPTLSVCELATFVVAVGQ